jgi:hypothetical protein
MPVIIAHSANWFCPAAGVAGGGGGWYAIDPPLSGQILEGRLNRVKHG